MTAPPQSVGSCPCGSCKTPCFLQSPGCPQHGAVCEPDDHINPPTVNGEVL